MSKCRAHGATSQYKHINQVSDQNIHTCTSVIIKVSIGKHTLPNFASELIAIH